MNYFKYKMIQPSGDIDSGVVKLPYQEVMSAISYLEREGGTTIFVRKLGRLASLIMGLGVLRSRKKMSRLGQAELLNNLALMLRTGVTLSGALKEAAEGADPPELSGDIDDIVSRIQGGASFSEAAESYPNIFSRSIIYLLRIGEETGKLDQMLQDACGHLKRMQAIVSDTKQALLYPMLVLTAIVSGLVFWFYYVVPKIFALFSDMDVALPRVTIFLVKVSEFFQNYGFHMLIGIVLAVGAVVAVRRKSRVFRKTLDQLLLRLPISQSIVSASVLAYITEYFSLLINSGIDIIQSLKILQNSIGNEVFRDKLSVVEEKIANGESVAESFRCAVIFPSFVVRVINVGEISGTLPEQLQYIAEEYRNKLSLLVATIGKMIEPIVLVIAGVFFAIIIVGLFLPIYDLVSRVQGL